MDDLENLFETEEQVFVYACYLPAKKTNVIMKAGNSHDYSHQSFFLRPHLKSHPINLKFVKKVEIKKNFIRENSVFAEYKAESKQLYKKCFEYDMRFSKLTRFVKDIKELEKVSEILLKYYGEMKNQFYSCIACSDYPTIQWMDFGNICEEVIYSLFNYLSSGASLTRISP